MSRPLRIEYPGAFYHIINKGLESRVIFEDDYDFSLFLNLLNHAYSKFHLIVHCYCLMNNHYHLYVETPKGNISRIMRHVDGIYTQKFNRKYNRTGPLFQGRYKSFLVEKETYSLELSRYIHLNPVRAGIVERPEDYQWSSFKNFFVDMPSFEFHKIYWLLSLFSKKKSVARKQFIEFTKPFNDSKNNWTPEAIAMNGSILGSAEFKENIKEKCISKKDDEEIPELKIYKKKKSLYELEQIVSSLSDNPHLQRKLRIYVLANYSDLTLKAISQRFGNIHYKTVSTTVSRLRLNAKTSKRIKNILEIVDKLCRMERLDPTVDGNF